MSGRSRRELSSSSERDDGGRRTGAVVANEARSVRPSAVVHELERHSTRRVRQRPPDAIRLDSGDPDVAPPEAVKKAVEDALGLGLSHYGDPFGDPDLREAVAADLTRRRGARIDADQVLVTHGAGAALAAAMAATLDPGDGVIIPDPCYSLIPDIARAAGARPIRVAHSPELHLDVDRIAAVAGTAKAIVLCNPCSPTGTLYERDELEAVVSIAEREGLVTFSDEVYDELVFDGSDFTSLLDVDGADVRLVYVQSFSKTYAMAGYRIGYLVAPPSIFHACARMHRTFNGCISPAIQRGALAALAVDRVWVDDHRREYERRRDVVLDRLEAIPGVEAVTPNAGLFVWTRYSAETRSAELATDALAHGVAVRAGAEFGSSGERHLAVSFSIGGDALETGLARLRAALSAASLGPGTS